MINRKIVLGTAISGLLVIITPAEMCGISIEGKNKWITLIQNSMNNS